MLVKARKQNWGRETKILAVGIGHTWEKYTLSLRCWRTRVSVFLLLLLPLLLLTLIMSKQFVMPSSLQLLCEL